MHDDDAVCCVVAEEDEEGEWRSMKGGWTTPPWQVVMHDGRWKKGRDEKEQRARAAAAS